jgi:two-component system, NtrC family, nitrogen regulation response regulator GlnG
MGERRKATVLVVEDDDSLLWLFAKVLQQAGFAASAVTTVQAATSTFGQQHFDAVICDLSVAGGKNVFNFVASARAQHPEIAFLIISGYTPEEIANHAEIIGIPVLEKPFAPPDLVQRISLLLDCQAA